MVGSLVCSTLEEEYMRVGIHLERAWKERSISWKLTMPKHGEENNG